MSCLFITPLGSNEIHPSLVGRLNGMANDIQLKPGLNATTGLRWLAFDLQVTPGDLFFLLGPGFLLPSPGGIPLTVVSLIEPFVIYIL